MLIRSAQTGSQYKVSWYPVDGSTQYNNHCESVNEANIGHLVDKNVISDNIVTLCTEFFNIKNITKVTSFVVLSYYYTH